jgi:hypothetical protein
LARSRDLKSGVVVDFDQIYNDAIKPAIEGCDRRMTTVLLAGREGDADREKIASCSHKSILF